MGSTRVARRAGIQHATTDTNANRAGTFPHLMSETVLGPLGMTNSTYEQPLPES